MAGGQKGLLDYVGYPVGQASVAGPAGGFRGLLDFAGYPVGLSVVGPGALPPQRILVGVGL